MDISIGKIIKAGQINNHKISAFDYMFLLVIIKLPHIKNKETTLFSKLVLNFHLFQSNSEYNNEYIYMYMFK